ncbi:MAG: hypothetical protein QOE33_3266 [Acidobacteriota bacterium]|nr:hypothetical protein [Acidobacteriota bacterium]
MEFLREYATEVLDYFTHLVVDRSGMSVKEALHEAIPAMTGMVQPLYQHINPSKVGGYRRQLAIGEEYAKRVLKLVKHPNAEDLTQRLVWGYPSHDFGIDYDELLEMGLPVQRLDLAQEDLIINALGGILEVGVSAYGFREEQKTKPKKAAAKKATRARSRKRPLPVPAADVKDIRNRSAA